MTSRLSRAPAPALGVFPGSAVPLEEQSRDKMSEDTVEAPGYGRVLLCALGCRNWARKQIPALLLSNADFLPAGASVLLPEKGIHSNSPPPFLRSFIERLN